MTRRSRSSLVRQMRTVESMLAVTILVPSPKKRRAYTRSECPRWSRGSARARASTDIPLPEGPVRPKPARDREALGREIGIANQPMETILEVEGFVLEGPQGSGQGVGQEAEPGAGLAGRLLRGGHPGGHARPPNDPVEHPLPQLGRDLALGVHSRDAGARYGRPATCPASTRSTARPSPPGRRSPRPTATRCSPGRWHLGGSDNRARGWPARSTAAGRLTAWPAKKISTRSPRLARGASHRAMERSSSSFVGSANFGRRLGSRKVTGSAGSRSIRRRT